MLSFLAAALVTAAVLGSLAGLRWWILYRRQPGGLVQPLIAPGHEQPRYLLAGMTAAAALAVLLAVDLAVTGPTRGFLALGIYAVGLFQAAARGSGLYRYGFHVRGLWYGHRWFPYETLDVAIVDQQTVEVRLGRRTLVLRTTDPLLPEVRLALTAVGWPDKLPG